MAFKGKARIPRMVNPNRPPDGSEHREWELNASHLNLLLANEGSNMAEVIRKTGMNKHLVFGIADVLGWRKPVRTREGGTTVARGAIIELGEDTFLLMVTRIRNAMGSGRSAGPNVRKGTETQTVTITGPKPQVITVS